MTARPYCKGRSSLEKPRADLWPEAASAQTAPRDARGPGVAPVIELLDSLILIGADEQMRRRIVETDAVDQRILFLIGTQPLRDLSAVGYLIFLHHRLKPVIKRSMYRSLVD